MKKILLLIAAIFAVNLMIAAPVAKADSPAWPLPTCVEEWLPSHDPQYPQDQLTTACLPPEPPYGPGWDGTLVIYAHGYVSPLPDPTIHGWADGIAPLESDLIQNSIAPAVLFQGFAFATTTYHKKGYAIEQAGDDIKALIQHFSNTYGEPDRVLLIGASEGALITTMLVEKHPATEDGGFVDGGLALCGPIGGMPYQLQYTGDFRTVFNFFFPGAVPGTLAGITDDDLLNWYGPDVFGLYHSLTLASAMAADPLSTAQLYSVTGADWEGDGASAYFTAERLLFFSVFGLNDVLATTGGMPYDNTGVWYTGSFVDNLLNAGVLRIESDRRAEVYARRFYEPSGKLRVPLVTVHTMLDPEVPYAHEAMYANLVASRGRDAYLVQYPVPGYGHCSSAEASFEGVALAGFNQLLAMVGP